MSEQPTGKYRKCNHCHKMVDFGDGEFVEKKLESIWNKAIVEDRTMVECRTSTRVNRVGQA